LKSCSPEILLAAVLLGSDQTVERVFRLLRWAANRPEPAAPPASSITGPERQPLVGAPRLK
jgi:hypothetical protein